MNDLIDGCTLTRYSDGLSVLELTAGPELVHVLVLPAAKGRRLVEWLRRRGRATMPEVWARLRWMEMRAGARV